MKNWDPDQVDVILSGVPIEGFSEQGLLKFKENDPRFKIIKGAKGDFTRSKNPGRIGMLTLQLMTSSASNAILSALHTTDFTVPGGAGVVGLLIRDKNGTSLLACPTCFVEGFPELPMGVAAEQIDWNIICLDYTLFIGGT